MAGAETLVSISIVERDTNGDGMVVWSYPSTDSALNQSILKRSGVLGDKGIQEECGVWYRTHNSWVYIMSMPVQDKDALPQTVTFGIAIQARDFDPEKYLRSPHHANPLPPPSLPPKPRHLLLNRRVTPW